MYFIHSGHVNRTMNGYSIGRQNGWLSANDIREMEDLNPLSDEEGGNLYLINGNMCKLSDAVIFAGQTQQEESEPEPEEKPLENNRKRGKR